MKVKTVLITTWICIFAILFPVFSTFAEELDSTNYKIVDITTQGGGTTESSNYSALLSVSDNIPDPRLYSTNYKVTADPASAFRPAVPTVSCFETTTDGYSNCITGPSGLSTGGMVSLCGGSGCYDKARFEIGDAPYQYDTSQSELVSYWPMDETSGSTVEDVKSSNDGTASGTTVVDGRYRKARSLDGNDDYVDLSSGISEIEGLSTGTITGWFKSSDNSGQLIFLISDKDSTSNFVYIGLNNITGGYSDESFYFIVRRGGAMILSAHVRKGDGYFTDNQWHHFAITSDSTGNKMYIDGSPETVTYQYGNSSTQELTNIDNPDTIRLGNRLLSGIDDYYYSGILDELLFFNSALSQSEVEALYESSRPSSNPSDALYAVQISTDNFASDIRYIDGSTNEPKNTVTLNDFRTKSQWESDTFNIQGLQQGTQYYLRIIALHGDFTQTEEGPSATTTTAGTSSSFDIDIAGTGGTSTETDPPFTVSFTGSNSLLAGAGAVVSDNLIWMDADTNGSGGFAIVQKGSNGGLYSTTHTAQIDSVTGDLDYLDEGFGLQSYYVDYNASSTGDISVMTNYNGSNRNVGIVDTDWNKIYDADGPIIDGRMALYLMARAGSDKQGATDYDETITFVFVPRY